MNLPNIKMKQYAPSVHQDMHFLLKVNALIVIISKLEEMDAVDAHIMK
jgi:hypothetical protein